MVDFNNETTVGRPAVDIVRVLILEARANTFAAIEFYNKEDLKGVEVSLEVIKRPLATWFLEHQAFLKRTMVKDDDKKLYNSMVKTLFVDKDITFDRLMEIVFFLNERLDLLNLTKIDTKKKYDEFDLEKEAEMLGAN